jgi:hypothetical protein
MDEDGKGVKGLATGEMTGESKNPPRIHPRILAFHPNHCFWLFRFHHLPPSAPASSVHPALKDGETYVLIIAVRAVLVRFFILGHIFPECLFALSRQLTLHRQCQVLDVRPRGRQAPWPVPDTQPKGPPLRLEAEEGAVSAHIPSCT